jgi:hypothetical protein
MYSVHKKSVHQSEHYTLYVLSVLFSYCSFFVFHHRCRTLWIWTKIENEKWKRDMIRKCLPRTVEFRFMEEELQCASSRTGLP